MQVKKHGIVTRVLPDRDELNALWAARVAEVRHNRENRTWYFCPTCCTAYDQKFKNGCYCLTPGDIEGDVDSEHPSIRFTELEVLPDQEVAEAAFRLGGYNAVYLLAEELVRARKP